MKCSRRQELEPSNFEGWLLTMRVGGGQSNLATVALYAFASVSVNQAIYGRTRWMGIMNF
jgi:hypothetical protein